MSKKTGGIFGARVKPKRQARGIALNTARPEEDIRIIFIGESADIDFRGPRSQIEKASKHPAADGMTEDELGNEICRYFDDGTDDMGPDLRARRGNLATMVACYLGRLRPGFGTSKEKRINAFVLCGWRKREGGYGIAMMGTCIPEDENPDCYDVLHDMLRESWEQMDKIGFADDSLYFKYRAKLHPLTVEKQLEELTPSSPRLQEVCDAAKTLLPNCRGLSGEEALDWLRENASPEEYQNALKASGEVGLLLIPCKNDMEKAQILKKAKSLPGKVELGPSLKGNITEYKKTLSKRLT